MVVAAAAVPGEGGQGLNLLHMLEGLREEYELEVFATGAHPDYRIHRIVRTPWIDRFFGLRLFRRLGDWHGFFCDRDFDRQVAARLPDCDGFQGGTGQCLHSLRRAQELGARTLLDVVTVHVDDGNPRVAAESRRLGFRARIHAGQMRRQRAEYAAAHLIRTMSGHARQTFLERGFSAGKVFALNPFLEPEAFPVADFLDPVFRVCFVGRLVVGKGFHHTVEAFKAARLPESELVLWGGTGERPVARLLREITADRADIVQRPVPIRSVGFGEVFGRASVFVHPSLADGFGYSVAEAMACGLPVIVTRTTGAADWVREGENGFVIEPGDVTALCERLKWCHQYRDRLPAMGRAARQTVESFTRERFRGTYLPHVRQLLG